MCIRDSLCTDDFKIKDFKMIHGGIKMLTETDDQAFPSKQNICLTYHLTLQENFKQCENLKALT